MPVNFLKLKPQIQSMVNQIKQTQSDLTHKLADCEQLLQQYAQDINLLQKTVEEAAAKNELLRCAIPCHEALNTHQTAVLPPCTCTILSADGSQITPDPHGDVLFGLVNVGIFRMQSGSGQAPQTKTFSDLLFAEKLENDSGLISENLISLQRDVYEREILADLSEHETAPFITLTDGQLELFHEPRLEKSFNYYFKKYLSALDRLACENTITAGYVDRPRANLVVTMLELLLPQNAINNRPFGGITDLDLFEKILPPGERSALFKLQFRSASDYDGKKTLHFFYLNVGTFDHPTIARVEIPLWVMENEESLNLLHAVLVDQSRQAGSRPYPYPLLRAHEIAVVKMDDRQQISELIAREMLAHGITPGLNSNKQSHKQHTGRKRM